MKTLFDLEETEVREYGIDIPKWIDRDIDVYQVAGMNQDGPQSGAYMPCVTYYNALKTMSEYGDEVIDYLDGMGVLDEFKPDSSSWGHVCVSYLSFAVSLWCSSVEDEILEAA